MMENTNKYAGYVKSFICCALLCTCGCASISQKKYFDTFNNHFSSGRYEEAAAFTLKKKGKKIADSGSLLHTLQAAAALRCARQYEQSASLFDECEQIIKQQDEQVLATRTAAEACALFINDTVLDYRAMSYDGIMVNTYKALDFWKTGEKKLARVEFNRALDRQRRAAELFAAELAKQKEALRAKQEEEDKKAQARYEAALEAYKKARAAGQDVQAPNRNDFKVDLARNVENPEHDKILQEKYSNLYAFEAYPDFINPFTTYIAGLFFMSEGDYSRATDLLKEAYGMVKDNPVVKDDFSYADNRQRRRTGSKNYTWVIFENGLGPVKEEFRIDLPLFVVTDKVKYAGVALPKLVLREQAYPHLVLKNNGGKVAQTSVVACMDRVVQTEFKKRYTSILIKTLTSCAIKTYIQYQLQREFGALGGFGGGIFAAATNSADIRMWTALPKEFQVAKITAPDDGTLLLETPAGATFSVEVPHDCSSLVYVKMPTAGSRLMYDVVKM